MKKIPYNAAVWTIGWIAVGALVGLGIGAYGYWRQTPEYRSTALIAIGEPAAATDIDDSAMVVGLPNVTRAVESSRLDLTLESSGQTAKVTAGILIQQGLAARKVETTSQGHVYEISFLASAPSTSKQVVDAVIRACRESEREDDAWTESYRLLTEAREDINRRLDAVGEELRRLELEQRSVSVDGKSFSSASARWELLQSSLDEERLLYSAIRERVRIAKDKIAAGTPDKEVLRTLSAPLELSLAGQSETAEMERAKAELAPLEADLEQALRRYGRLHPTVVAIEKQMDTIRKNYGISKRSLMADLEATSSGWADAAEGLGYLTAQGSQSEQRIDELLVELDEVGVELATQSRLALRERRLRDSLAQEQQFRAELLERLGKLPVPASPHARSVTVLRPAENGQLVSPLAAPILTVGCVSGILASIGAVVIRSLANMMSFSEGTESSAITRTETTA